MGALCLREHVSTFPRLFTGFPAAEGIGAPQRVELSGYLVSLEHEGYYRLKTQVMSLYGSCRSYMPAILMLPLLCDHLLSGVDAPHPSWIGDLCSLHQDVHIQGK